MNLKKNPEIFKRTTTQINDQNRKRYRLHNSTSLKSLSEQIVKKISLDLDILPKRKLLNGHCYSVIPYVPLLVAVFYSHHAVRNITRILERLLNFTAKDVNGSIDQHHFPTDSRHCQAGYELPFICRYVVNFTAIQPARATVSSSNKDHFSIFTDTTSACARLFQRCYFLLFVSLAIGVKCSRVREQIPFVTWPFCNRNENLWA